MRHFEKIIGILDKKKMLDGCSFGYEDKSVTVVVQEFKSDEGNRTTDSVRRGWLPSATVQ